MASPQTYYHIILNSYECTCDCDCCIRVPTMLYSRSTYRGRDTIHIKELDYWRHDLTLIIRDAVCSNHSLHFISAAQGYYSLLITSNSFVVLLQKKSHNHGFLVRRRQLFNWKYKEWQMKAFFRTTKGTFYLWVYSCGGNMLFHFASILALRLWSGRQTNWQTKFWVLAFFGGYM